MFRTSRFARELARQTTNYKKHIYINSRCFCVNISNKLKIYASLSSHLNGAKHSRVIFGGFTNSVRSYCKELPEHIMLTLPALSPTMETGTLVSWHKVVGDRVNVGDLLAEIQTDKAVMGWDTSDEGYVARIFVEADTKDIPIGKPLCIIVNEEADIAAFKDYLPPESDLPDVVPSAPEPPPSPPPPPTMAVAPPVIAAPTSLYPPPSGRFAASPFAKKMAVEQGLDLAGVAGSGPGGRIRSADLAAVAVAVASPSQHVATPQAGPGQESTDIPLSNMRKVIAKRLMQSKQTIPHYYLSSDVHMDRISRLRAELNAMLAKKGIKLSVNDFIIGAAARACMSVPETNSAWMEHSIRQYVRNGVTFLWRINNPVEQYHSVDMSIAVATEGGLITPIIFSANTKGLARINSDIKMLAEKARAGKLAPHEFQGGTFTISNLGMFGVKSFSAVINPPQVCILAVGATEPTVVPDDSTVEGYSVQGVMSVTLSCDHRVVDGAVGAQWLKEFKQLLEYPESMLL